MQSLHRNFTWALLPIALTLSACGGGSSSDVSTVDLSFSDAAVDGVDEVVVTVERITFRRGGDENAEDVVVETFPADDSEEPQDTENTENAENAENATVANNETFQLNLLDYKGVLKRLVVDSVELPVGEYSNMLIDVIDVDDEGNKVSYVLVDGIEKELKVPSDTLKLGGFTIVPTSAQSLVVEFGLQQSMTYNPGPDRYILKPRGVRIVDVEEAAVITGEIKHGELQSITDDSGEAICNSIGTDGNVGTKGYVYLYDENSIGEKILGDNFDPDLNQNDENHIEPVASSSLDSGTFTLSYLEPGSYRLAVGCHDQDVIDDADVLQMLTVPNPADQVISVNVELGESLECNIPFINETCGAPTETTDTAE